MINITIDNNEKNRKTIRKYKELSKELYLEPVDGKFDNITQMILGELESEDNSNGDAKGDTTNEDIREEVWW